MEIIFIFFILIALYLFHIAIRNEKTCSYCCDLSYRICKRACNDINEGKEPKYGFDVIPSYWYVLYSLKLIKDESFLSQDVIYWLNDNKYTI